MPGFHSWFVRKKATIFKLWIVSCWIQDLQLISNTQNSKEKYSREKFNLKVTSLLKTLHQWHLAFEKETKRALYGQRKFRLAPSYEQFYRERIIYLSWSQVKKQEHMSKCLQFARFATDTYK